MKTTKLFTVLVIFSTILFACGGQEGLPTPSPVPATITSTSSPIPAPPTLTSTPTNTSTPEPTPIPGVQVLPVSSLEDGIPWLPLEEDNRPMSVYYGFNMEKPPFDNLLVRQAFSAAVDREQIAQEALNFTYRDAAPATSLTPPQVLGRDLYNAVGISFDPARAKDLFQEAGYTDAASFPSVTLLVSTRGEARPGAYFRMAESIVGMWETYLGVKVTIEVSGGGGYDFGRLQNDPPEIYQIGWGADYIDPDNFLKALLHSTGGLNFGGFSSQEFDRLVDEAASRTEPGERLLLYIQAEQILTELEAGIIPLFHSYVPRGY